MGLQSKSLSSLTFLPNSKHSDPEPFGPRLGQVVVHRQSDVPTCLEIETPSLITATSRGVIPHLSRDHVRITEAIRWINVPFESFLEHVPPVPTIQLGSQALHKFLGYIPSQHVLSMSPRDPFDGRAMPPNSKDHITVYCTRGVRKMTSHLWEIYAAACNPDAVVALSDIPFTQPPHSQKRITKSLDRSGAWLLDMLKSQAQEHRSSQNEGGTFEVSTNVLVHMAGDANVQARRAFSDHLMEVLESKESEQLKPLRKLDDGIAGYVFDLVPLRRALSAKTTDHARPEIDTIFLEPPSHTYEGHEIPELLKASLDNLPSSKPRIVNSARSPHEILRLIRDVGIDLFDAHWAQRAADIGVALDFRFPVRIDIPGSAESEELREAVCFSPRKRSNGTIDLGHNLYSAPYAHDHSRLASSFLDGDTFRRQVGDDTTTSSNSLLRVCPCAACSPRVPSNQLTHSRVDEFPFPASDIRPPFMRSYLHHLLHTHEMSAHSLLVMHNLSVLDLFFSGVRELLARPSAREDFAKKVDVFLDTYDETMVVFDEAKLDWKQVELARGKGRLTRENVKQAQSSLGTAVEL